MFYRKTSTNYSKWDMFESDETDEEDKEPIVPKDDPNFQAMAADFDKRAKDRRESKVKAIKLKDQGNAAMKAGLYKTANKHYSEALDEKRDLLPCYTNRALVRLKIELWQEAIDDCTRVVEYCEVFDDGFDKQPDLCFKAFIRRAQAHRGLRDFDEAILDLENASKIYPQETDPSRLTKLYKEDKELDERINKIMANADALKGKEFIDFLLDFLTGRTHKAELKPGERLPKFCHNALKADEAQKLLEILK